MLIEFQSWLQSRIRRNAPRLPYRKNRRVHTDLARLGRLIAVPLLLFVLTACATPQELEPLEFDAPSAKAPRDLALHIIEVDDDGEGDEIDMRDIVRLETGKYATYDTDIPPCERAEEADRKFRDEEIVLREQFACVIENALKRHKIWTAQGDRDWPCGTGDDQPLCLAFYFNGGLNSRGDALQTAGNTYREIEHDRMYPVYMVWPTGALESYWEDWTRVRAGRLTNWDDPSTLASTPVRPVSDLMRGLASTPAAWATSAFEFYQTGFGLRSKAYTTKRDWKLHVSSGQHLENGATAEIKPNQNLYFSPWEEELRFPERRDLPDGAPVLPDGQPVSDLLVQDLLVEGGVPRAAREVASFAYHAATAPVRALMTAPMVGLGEAAWRNMVRRTRTSVRSATEFPDEFAEERAPRGSEDANAVRRGEDSDEAASSKDPNSVEIQSPTEGCGQPLHGEAAKLRRCYPRGSGGFARVFQWLESCMIGRLIGTGADGCPLSELEVRDYETLRKARIIMIGHSMGAIVVNEILQLFPDLPYESLVYMAGAASVRDTSRAVTPLLVDNLGCTKFFGLMLHPMNEARESTGYGLLPSGSLLAYVDDFLEVPKTVPDRTVGQWRNLRATQHLFFPEDARRWMLFRVFDRAAVRLENGKRMPNPVEHGGFNDERVPFWRESFWKPEEIEFPDPEADCEAVFTSRLRPPAIEVGAGIARAITIPAEEMARKWQMVWQEVDGGKTVAITSGGETIARIVPVPEDEEDAAVLAP